MQWKSNSGYTEELANGTIFELKNSPCTIKIHKIIDCGDNLFLSCPMLDIRMHSLDTTDFDTAVKNAQQYVQITIDRFATQLQTFLTANTANEFVRY